MKVAIVHDWLIHMRGGEKVLEALAELYPKATIYTLFYRRHKLSPILQKMDLHASFLHHLPGIHLYYRWLLPILPLVIQTLKIEPVDLVISSSHCVAKGIQIPLGAFHLCYCHTPMRYLWGFENVYFSKYPWILKPFLALLLNSLRHWDKKTSKKVNAFIANSENVRNRIRNFYERDAHVIYPPLDFSFFSAVQPQETKDYYLAVSAFVPYKKIDIVIEAFNGLKKKLLIVGSGPLDFQYRSLRRNPHIHFLGNVNGKQLRTLYAQARALIFPAEEDFGIVPLEAQAAGTPVIAFGKGGALESVKSGIFFEAQTPEAVREAVQNFEAQNFERSLIPEKVRDFDKVQFKKKISELIDSLTTPQKFYAVH